MKTKSAFRTVIILGGAFLFFVSCRKEEPVTPPPLPAKSKAFVEIQFCDNTGGFVPGPDRRFVSGPFHYSIESVSLYISNLCLVDGKGTAVQLSRWLYLDAALPAEFEITPPKTGNYPAVSFDIGLDSALNKSFALPPTAENNNMQWPEPMGGGYHFLKIEGSFSDSSGIAGYALHLGRDHTLRHVTLPTPVIVSGGTDLRIGMRVNVREWFSTPHVYDFVGHGNYIMGNDTIMDLVADNGTDAFFVTQ